MRNDASATRFAFLSESRIVELGTLEMAHEQTNTVVDYYEEFSRRNTTLQPTLVDALVMPIYSHHGARR